MISGILSAQDAASVRTFLALNGYDFDGLLQRIGTTHPPAQGEEQQIHLATREKNLPNLLIRLFLLGGQVDAETVAEFVPENILPSLFSIGLLRRSGDGVVADVVIVPIDNLLFASDAFRMLGTNAASEFVLPASTHSANLLRLLTIRDAVTSTLDLGCGCGIHALFAAGHSDKVVATDISERAALYTEFNARLNAIDNIEVRRGSLFEPVASERFDLIVSNPPFIIAPGTTFVYRDADMMLDEFCRTLVTESVGHLQDMGHLQMLCEWVEISGEPWQQRVSAWVRGCDAWILHSGPVPPADYVERRSSDLCGDAVHAGNRKEWSEYLATNLVIAIHPGVLTLRRRSAENWLHVRSLTDDVASAAGQTIVDGIAACDFLALCDDESLLASTLQKNALLVIDETVDTAAMEESSIRLRIDDGIQSSIDVDNNIVAYLNRHDGERSVAECVDAFKAAVSKNDPDLTQQLIGITRQLVYQGVLRPIDLNGGDSRSPTPIDTKT